ncbi:hypothetical protein AGMMS49525_02460 [Bacteroidia bacterium]|nr:hypothetical protein AGMMS49525_02460 [Bacteroidia bacterium]
MRKLLSVLVATILLLPILAQTPDKISYQAVIRDAQSKLVSNKPVGIKVSILKGSEFGVAVYEQAYFPTTNANGLVSLEIGGSPDFRNINWADDTYFVKTETDPAGGTNYVISGTSQLLTVPYALHAKTAESIVGGSFPETDPVFVASPAWRVSAADIHNLLNLSGINTGDQDLSDLATKAELIDSIASIHTIRNLTLADSIAFLRSISATKVALADSVSSLRSTTKAELADSIAFLRGMSATKVALADSVSSLRSTTKTELADSIAFLRGMSATKVALADSVSSLRSTTKTELADSIAFLRGMSATKVALADSISIVRALLSALATQAALEDSVTALRNAIDLLTPKCGGVISGYTTANYSNTGLQNLCWTTQNITQLPASYTTYNDSPYPSAGYHGYYYAWSEAAAACQALGTGWSLPNATQWTAIKTAFPSLTAGTGTTGTTAQLQGAWNSGVAAGFGRTAAWTDWNSIGYWWSSGAADQYFYLSNGSTSMTGPSTTSVSDYFYTVRCVRSL